MSQVPNQTARVLDGGLGLAATTPDLLHSKIAVCSGGPRLTPIYIPDLPTLASIFKGGPGVRAGAYHLAQTGGFWMVRTATSTNGTISAVVKQPNGIDTGTLAAAVSVYSLHAAIAAGAALNVTTGWIDLPIPGKVKIALAAPGVATNYTLQGYDLAGNIVSEVIALGAAPSNNTSVNEYTKIIALTTPANPEGVTTVTTEPGTPIDQFEVIVEVMVAGSVASTTMQYRYSLDNGRTYSPTTQVPVGGVVDLQTYAPGTTNAYLGFKITFTDGAGPNYFNKGTKYTFTTTAPAWDGNALIAGIQAMTADRDIANLFSGYHCVGPADGTIFVSVDSQLTTDETQNILYKWAYLETVRMDSTAEATWEAALRASFTSTSMRVGVIADDMNIENKAYGTFDRANWGSVYIARLMACPISESPAHVKGDTVFGTKTNLQGVTKLYQTMTSTVPLTGANFVTARQFPTRTGFYVTKGILKAPENSDYKEIKNRRVMDVALTIGYDAFLDYLQASPLADPRTSRLASTEANKIASEVMAKERIALLAGSRQHVSGLDVYVDDTRPFLQERILYGYVSLVPRGLVDAIVSEFKYVAQL